MTFHDFYVTHPKDPAVSWEDFWSDWRAPEGLSICPATAGKMGLMWEILTKISDGTFPGRQLDWGAHAADVDRDQLVELVPRATLERPPNVRPGWPFTPEAQARWEPAKEIDLEPGPVETLPPGDYLLIAMET